MFCALTQHIRFGSRRIYFIKL